MKQKIKSLFEQFINKFSASYLAYRKQNYPDVWIVCSISYAEDWNWKHQYVKLLYNENKYTCYALIFEHEGSVYIANDKALSDCPARALPFGLRAAFSLAYWHKNNYLFKLSSADFEIALNSAKDYEEFILMSERISSGVYKAATRSFYGSLKEILREAATTK